MIRVIIYNRNPTSKDTETQKYTVSSIVFHKFVSSTFLLIILKPCFNLLVLASSKCVKLRKSIKLSFHSNLHFNWQKRHVDFFKGCNAFGGIRLR